ncbi:MAG: diacylglycerol/polyprenol kinase family protein [Promethearchaeota archaeon]
MYFLFTSLILIVYSILTLIYTIENKKNKIENHVFTNEILISLLFLTAALLFPFMYQFHSPSLSQNSLNFLWISTSIFFMVEMGIWGLTLLYNAIISKRNPLIMAERDYSKFCEEFNSNWVDDLKSELGRKFLHLFTCLVIFFFWTIGTILNVIGILAQWGLDNYSFSYWLTITVGYGFVFMFQVADLIRLNKYYMLPNWARKWYLDMKQSELYTFIASTPLVLSFSPFIFAPFPILAAVALITTGSDGVACIIGKKFGKHHLRTNNKKTIEGLIAGGLSTFVVVLLISILYYPWMPIAIEKIIIMSVIATLIFMLIDAYVKNISDNILNPLLTGFAMWIIFLV